ncbi:acyl-CoA carboxylase subunit epsilon [Micromonospora sp. NPDC049559]|uniref:acyl-CoA carboxylase subunit epsilon n=1 Tax=Micromonospora sp. NPDC049559 TaxID=3155923 RepID=UPI003442E81D
MSEHEPVFRVIRGIPTDEELAALVGVIFARPRPAAPAAAPTPSVWATRARPGTVSASGVPARPGVDAWRTSGLPH